MLFIVGVAMAVIAAPAWAQAAPTPAPDPSNATAMLVWGLWLLGGLVLAIVMIFVVIARMSRGTVGGDG